MNEGTKKKYYVNVSYYRFDNTKTPFYLSPFGSDTSELETIDKSQLKWEKTFIEV